MADNKPTTNAPSKGFNLLEFINSNTQAVLFFLLGLISFVIFKDFIFFKKIYLFTDIGSDSINMYIPWFSGYADYLKNEGVPGWSFQQGMGQNIFPLWLGDFFSNFMMFFGKKNIPYALAYMEIAKIMLGGFVFYRFLKELKISNYVSLIFALLYAFSGFMIMGGTWVIYSIEALNIAVILFGFERWLNHKKYFWFVIGIMLLTFLQPALLLPWTIFLAFYITARYFDMNDKGVKDFMIFTAKTAGLAVLGVLLSAYQLLPNILQIIESPRVGGDSTFYDKLKGESIFNVAHELLRMSTVFRSFGTDMLGNGTNFKGWYNYLESPVFYCGLLSLVAFPLFFTSLNKKQKRIYVIITVIFYLPLIFPWFRYAFWAFQGDYFRTFSLVIVLFLITYAARGFNFMEQQGKANKIVVGVTVLALLFLLYTPSTGFKPALNTGMRTTVTFFVLAYGLLVFRLSDAKAGKNILKIVLLFGCVIELMYFSYSTINNREVLRTAQIKEKVGYNDYTVDAVKYLKDIDKSFYRINKEYTSGLAIHQSINDAKVQGFYGTASYHSFNQKYYIKFLADFGVINPKDEFATRWASGLGSRPLLFTIACGKYWLSKAPGNNVAQFGFDSIAKFGDVKVFRNKYAVPFGVTYNTVISEKDFKKLSNIQKDLTVAKACVIPEEDETDFSSFKRFNLADTALTITYDTFGANIMALKKDSLNITKFSENSILGNVNVAEPKILFFQFPLDRGWKATINGNDTKIYRINSGLTGVLLNKGANTVELSFKPRLKKEGSMVSIASILALAGLIGLSKFRKKAV